MEPIKGFRDYTGMDAQKRAYIKKVLISTFEKYGFEPAETPVIESEEFVKGDNSQGEDEAVSDIYKLKDKGERKLALRYEFTFQLKRIMNNKKLPYKRYEMGPVFRDEPATANRFRQITQCDADIIGSSVKDDAEVLSMATELFKTLKIKNVIYVGNRALLNEILDELKVKDENRNSVLREVDKLECKCRFDEKDVIANLKKLGAGKIPEILKKPEKYFERYKNYQDIVELRKSCNYYGVKFVFNPSLVRGLSYYNRNVWEIRTEEMKETITGGGSYIFNGFQCTGISFGLERISNLFELKEDSAIEKYLVISLEQDKEAIKLVQNLREKGKSVQIYYGKPSKALDYANSYGINNVIFVGSDEVKAKKFKVKDMKSGKEKELKI
jgi:histidyl-tRNA synthetase